MTPDELNRVNAQVRAELETEAIQPLAAAYERLLRGAGRRMARKVRARSYVTAGVVAAVLPPDEDEVIPPELHDQVRRLTDRERAQLVKLLIASYQAHEIAWDVHGNFTQEMLDKIGAHASFAAEKDLRDAYRSVIQTAAEEGYSIPRTAGAVSEAVDGIAAYRATALARTDLIGLVNAASQSAASEAFAGREDVTKTWLATNDDRTRETHAEADGQEVPLNEYFDVGGAPLMYPGDPDGPDEEVINCRCTQVYSGSGEPPPEQEIVASAVRDDTYPAPRTTEEEGVSAEPVTAAVTITVEDNGQPATADRQRTAWEGILAIEGAPTSDGRYLIPGEIGHRDLPLPLAPSHEDQHATETVGRIDTLEWIPVAEFNQDGFDLPDDLPPHAVVIWGTGSFDGSPEAQDALRQLENGVGVSLDLPIERKAFIDATTFEEVDPEVVLENADPLEILFGGTPDGYLRGMGGKIGGLSLASIAAFEETTIRVVEGHAIVASGFALRRGVIRQSILKDVVTEQDVLVASAAPIAPPRAWFFVDEPDEPTPITILPDGQFYGHLALWNSCHAGKSNGAYSACMYAPPSPSGYMHYHLGAMLCDDGSEVPVGRVTIGTGHAPLNLNAAKARAHYDNTGTVVGFCRAKDGIFGIWVCGAIKSDATAEQIRDFRACPPSGDWRSVDGRLELQAALAVNTPAYVVPRSQLSLAASADSLEIATLILGAPEDDDFAEALRIEHEVESWTNLDVLLDLAEREEPMAEEVSFGLELAQRGFVSFRDYSPEQRRAMAKSGEALPDGSYPIANCSDADNAIRAQGRGGASQSRIVAHIRKRVRALGCTGSIFDPYK